MENVKGNKIEGRNHATLDGRAGRTSGHLGISVLLHLGRKLHEIEGKTHEGLGGKCSRQREGQMQRAPRREGSSPHGYGE